MSEPIGCCDRGMGWTMIKCCNVCGRPHPDEELDWKFDVMQDHEIAELVNLICDELEPICDNQNLRSRISKVVKSYFHEG